MAPKLDSAIYGADPTGLANRVSSDALSGGGRDGAPDNWGDAQDTKRAQSYANVGRESLGPSDPKTPWLRKQQDAGNIEDEALNMPDDYKDKSFRHRRGPETSTDEGAGVKNPPKFDRKPGSSSGPVYTKKES